MDGGMGGGGSRPRAVPLTTKPFKVVDDDAEVLMDDDDLPEAPSYAGQGMDALIQGNIRDDKLRDLAKKNRSLNLAVDRERSRANDAVRDLKLFKASVAAQQKAPRGVRVR